jgi:hypothetical protein
MSAWGQIYGDEVGATYTVTTTSFEIFPGTTSFVCQTGSNRFITCQADPTLGIRFIVGKDGKGLWNFTGGLSYTGSIGNRIYHTSLFRNGTKIEGSGVERKIATGGDVGAVPIMGKAVLKNSTDIVDFRLESTASTGVKFTVNHFEIFANRITTSTAVGTV